ncbi:hypothetical protein BDR22DRAFT_363248 [Usnea florida]
MSFGFSVSDIITLGEWALKLYHSCKESSQTIRILSGELKSLRAVLKESEKTLLVRPPSPDSGARLQEVLAPCRDVLNDSQELIDKFERPGAKRSKIRDGVNLCNEKISEMRDRITSSVTMDGLHCRTESGQLHSDAPAGKTTTKHRQSMFCRQNCLVENSQGARSD